MARRITALAPAKTNLFLSVGDVRPDGYHNVTTVLCPLALFDWLVVIETEKPLTSIICTSEVGVELAIEPEDNLVLRALEAMRSQFAETVPQSQTQHYEITLEKTIPTGAGLGGGSSDAAAMIAVLAKAWGIPQNDDRLATVARSLGSDVAFFLHGNAALMKGRGDEFVRSFPMPQIDVVVIKPDESVSTPAAYKTFDWFAGEHDRDIEAAAVTVSLAALIEGLLEDNIRKIAESTYNNMTQAAYALVPEIKQIIDMSENTLGVLSAFVSGSGSAVIVFCENAYSAETVLLQARDHGLWAMATTTTSIGVDIVREDSV